MSKPGTCTMDIFHVSLFFRSSSLTYTKNYAVFPREERTPQLPRINPNCHEYHFFAHCTSLQEVSLPLTLHIIRVKAFMNCAALPELAVPPSLRYIASRAFLDCTALRKVVKLPGQHKWPGLYAEENAFAICPEMRWPTWLHMIPDTGHVSGLA